MIKLLKYLEVVSIRGWRIATSWVLLAILIKWFLISDTPKLMPTEILYAILSALVLLYGIRSWDKARMTDTKSFVDYVGFDNTNQPNIKDLK